MLVKRTNCSSSLSDAELAKSMGRYSKLGKVLVLSSIPVLLTTILLICMTSFNVVGVVCFILVPVLFLTGIHALSTAKKMFKVNIVHDILAGIIDDCVYRPKQSISKKQIYNTKLISGWNSFSGEDYIEGTYKGHRVAFSDIHLERVTTNSKGSHTRTTIFQGNWLICELAKNLPAVMRLSEGRGESNVKTENIAFNNKYNIFTDNPHYMFYVLTPQFMEQSIAADEAADARTYFCFAEDKVHVAIDSRHDTFEIRSTDISNPDLARERIREEMAYITGILDELFQNNYLFGEE
jgi:hypothetical protein